MELISVIVPIYNVEEYLPRCIESLISQTINNIEILLIDDGSTDNSGEICEKYSCIDDRIRVFHKKNGGLSDARNYGLDKMNGDYVGFVDSDDYVSPDYLFVLYNIAKKGGAEVSCVDCMIDGDLDIVNHDDLHFRVIDNKEALNRCFTRRGFGISACMKLYRKELFDSVRFPVGKLYEDADTIPYILAKTNQVAYTDYKLYFWLQRTDSIMHRSLMKRDLYWFDVFGKLYSFINDNYNNLMESFVCRYTDDLFLTILHRLIYDNNYLKKCKIIKNRISVSWAEVKNNKYLSKKRKLSFMLFYYAPILYKWTYYCYKHKSFFATKK